MGGPRTPGFTPLLESYGSLWRTVESLDVTGKASSGHSEPREVDQASGHRLHGNPAGCAEESWPSLGTWVGTKAGVGEAHLPDRSFWC